MGMEYSLRFTYPAAASIAEVLRPLPGIIELTTSLAFEFRSSDLGDGMPDASARIEPYGLYYCDFGGSGREYLGLILARLASRFGPVTVAELE